MSGFSRSFTADPATGLEICHFVGLEQSFPPHFHEYYLLGCLLSGERCFLFNGKSARIATADIVLLNPRDCHSCNSLGPCEWLCAHIPAALMRRLTGETENPHFQKNIFHSPLAGNLFMKILTQTPQTCAPLLRGVLNIILCHLPITLENPSDSEAGIKLADVSKYLAQNLEAGLSLAEISQWAGMDKFEFLRKFFRHTGLTPHRYRNALRVNLGRKLLRSGASIADCAMESGFYDQSHFNNSFHKNTGLTPAFFRSAYYPGNAHRRSAFPEKSPILGLAHQ